MYQQICILFLTSFVLGAFSQCQPGTRMPQCDNTCINNEGSTAMIQCCNNYGFNSGGCPDGRTVFCTNGISNNCPPQRTPQCDIICIENRGSDVLIDCCKANGFQSGACPNGRDVICMFS